MLETFKAIKEKHLEAKRLIEEATKEAERIKQEVTQQGLTVYNEAYEAEVKAAEQDAIELKKKWQKMLKLNSKNFFQEQRNAQKKLKQKQRKILKKQ
jgi:hypothetical protein